MAPHEHPLPNAAQAQLFMSQLMDGELGPEDAARLNAYLERHPEAIEWMETLETLRDASHPSPSAALDPNEEAEAIDALSLKIGFRSAAQKPSSAATASRRSRTAALFGFPASFLRPLAAAAAVALVAGGAWLATQQQRPATGELPLATVEFVSTEIPNASTAVYSDEESGWTVVWVETIEPEPAKRG